MMAWLLSRFGQGAITLALLVIAVFVASRATGDPIAYLVPLGSPPEQVDQVRAQFGLDDSYPVQFEKFVTNAVQGNFGTSIRTREDALHLVLTRAWASLQLALIALAISLVLALVLGTISALTAGSATDQGVRLVSIVGLSMPSFMVAIGLIYIFSVHYKWLPPVGKGDLKHYIMPVVTLTFFPLAALTRLIRAALLEALNSSYAQFARLKGLSSTRILIRHALPNTLVPVASFTVVNLSLLLGGAVVTETIFAWPGLGALAYQAIEFRDFPVIQTIVIVVGIFIILLNILLDLMIGWLDPRIRSA